ncbi:RICIN domain-containing protein [Streptomyces griseosporeus]|uniref:RICIN domain-containing protein n=1 Tax=Streptomyces griseosporeus TaxID=1910 RepID=UPI0036F88B35
MHTAGPTGPSNSPNPGHPHATDAQLSAQLKKWTGATPAFHPVGELLDRHWAAAFAYARLCTDSGRAAGMLTTAAFTRLFGEALRQDGPSSAWRPHLLVTVGRIAVEWDADGRRELLHPALRTPDDSPQRAAATRLLPPAHRRTLSQAFQRLPQTARCVLWHAEVEAEPPVVPAGLLGLDEEDVRLELRRARERLRAEVLQVHRETAPEEECRRFLRLLDVTLRRGGTITDPDLHRHLDRCGPCRYTADQLAQFDGALGFALAEAVLGWAARAYVTARLTSALGEGDAEAPPAEASDAAGGYGETEGVRRATGPRPERPAEGAGTLSEGAGSPAEGFGTPSEWFGSQSEGFGTPSEGFGAADAWGSAADVVDGRGGGAAGAGGFADGTGTSGSADAWGPAGGPADAWGSAPGPVDARRGGAAGAGGLAAGPADGTGAGGTADAWGPASEPADGTGAPLAGPAAGAGAPPGAGSVWRGAPWGSPVPDPGPLGPASAARAAGAAPGSPPADLAPGRRTPDRAPGRRTAESTLGRRTPDSALGRRIADFASGRRAGDQAPGVTDPALGPRPADAPPGSRTAPSAPRWRTAAVAAGMRMVERVADRAGGGRAGGSDSSRGAVAAAAGPAGSLGPATPPGGTRVLSRRAVHRARAVRRRNLALAVAAVSALVALPLVLWAAGADDSGSAGPGAAPSPDPGAGTATDGPSWIDTGGTQRAALVGRLHNSASGLCVDLAGGRAVRDAETRLAACSASAAQQWSYEPDGLLRSVAAPDLCLDSHLGYSVRLAPCADAAQPGGKDVRYDFTLQGALISRGNQDLALAPAATDGSGALVLKNRADDPAQRWTIDTAAPGLRRAAVTWDAAP